MKKRIYWCFQQLHNIGGTEMVTLQIIGLLSNEYEIHIIPFSPVDKNKIILKSGIYITNTILENHQYISITFIGKSKSFKNTKYSVETHLLNYYGDNFYNKKIKVIFIKKIGNVKKYKNINKLKDDINNYILMAKYFFK